MIEAESVASKYLSEIAILLVERLLIETWLLSDSPLISLVLIPFRQLVPTVVIVPSLAIITAPSNRLIFAKAESLSSEAREIIEFWSIKVVPTNRELAMETL